MGEGDNDINLFVAEKYLWYIFEMYIWYKQIVAFQKKWKWKLLEMMPMPKTTRIPYL